MIDWDVFWKALGVALPAIGMIYTFLATRRKDVDERLHAGSKRMDALEMRMQAAEQTLNGMPGKEDTHRLEMMLAEMAGDMKAMRATMRGMSESLQRTEDIVGRHEDHLRENS